MKTTLIWVLVSSLLFLTACKAEDSEGDAKDYMPFTKGGYLYHWTTGSTLRIYLPSDLDASSVTGYQTSLYRPAFIAGVAKWSNTLSSLGISYDYSGIDTSNDIKVEWDDGSGVDYGVLGFAEVYVGNDPSRRVVITTRKNYQNDETHDAAEITAISAHEFGHMLGIWSHSFDLSDLMYPIAVGLTDPSNRDRETMRYLYGFTPDVNLSSLPVNTALSNPTDSLPTSGYFIRSQSGPNPKNFEYQEFEYSSPDGVVPLNPGLD